ncbi:DUF2384 domain-containing protein [Undibacterium seohonense]|uniref:DUF2384 domain-containing protein n=1 Tax=Undibacterium seohonense TaxID=1344950 RepID=A0ABR6X337_9BURK|nr:antitoxin Xre/MbcA/ParS toxin-binding domain-containing protein [Undibacterium seohonense]MBC3807053.1 DUF2384 domain-containing protein [Undibacterium seohonense]
MNKSYLSDKRITSDSVGVRVFRDICKLWGLSYEQSLILLAGHQERKNHREEAFPELTTESMQRISYILGIYENLQLLLPDSTASDKWMSAKNNAPIFNGKSALEKILSGDIQDLKQVHQYLYALSVGN